jgi:sec-independent protein translocase protein TatB
VFNLSGSEVVFLLLIGLVVLGPEKLPDAMRKFGRLYQEIKNIASGVQRDLRTGFDDPLQEIKKTAEEAKKIFLGKDEDDPAPVAEPTFIPYEDNEQPSGDQEP